LVVLESPGSHGFRFAPDFIGCMPNVSLLCDFECWFMFGFGFVLFLKQNKTKQNKNKNKNKNKANLFALCVVIGRG
jgi:hypothetical protein